MKSKTFYVLAGSLIIAVACQSQNNNLEKKDTTHVKTIYQNQRNISKASAQIDSLKVEWEKIINKVKQSKN